MTGSGRGSRVTGLRHVVRAANVRPEPWANGAGVTRQLWLEQAHGDGPFEWRLSVADLVADASFSIHPGVDRVFLPLEGLGHLLGIDGRLQRLAPRVPVRFAGEAAVSLVAPTPGLALNLMARRGAGVDLDVRRVRTGQVLARRTRAVFVLEGRIALAGGPVLKPLEVALLDDVVSTAAGTDAVVAEVRVD